MRPRRFRLLPPLLLGLVVLVGAPACSLMLDFDETAGHPCTDTGRCLLGYECINNVCVKGGLQVKDCSSSCPSGQRCDLRVGHCASACDATVCPTGQACADGQCQPVKSGLGAPCTMDADCADAIPGCSTDPTIPAQVACVCLTPTTGGKGVCLGVPAAADDCGACGKNADCLTGRFSGAGSAAVCVPKGFRTCDSPVDCADKDNPADCVLFGWGQDPGNHQPGQPASGSSPLGFLAACATPTPKASVPPGGACDAAAPEECETGLCLPASGGAFVCSQACKDDAACAGVGDGRCVQAPVTSDASGAVVFDDAMVCGTKPTLGAACDDASGGATICGTDAPDCGVPPGQTTPVCTRGCLDDADCGSGQGFTCRPESSQCF